SIWRTDEDTKEYLTAHNRPEDYKELNPAKVAYYDGMVHVDLSEVKPMIALPFHPSNVYEIETLNENLEEILKYTEEEGAKIIDNPNIEFKLRDKIVDGKLRVEQGIIAGCAGGTYSSIMDAVSIIKGHSCGNDEFSLAVYPSSQPVFMDLLEKGAISTLMAAGATIKTAFCGPCFGAGDTPANNGLSIRHTTRNFPNREGSKPGNGQMSSVALMDARSIAATAANGGILTSATDLVNEANIPGYKFDDSAYRSRVYQGFEKADDELDLVYGPNIKDWPAMSALADNILLKVCSKILDEVTTTDELIPSGETSAFRSNPLKLAEFALSRRDPEYVGNTKAVDKVEKARLEGQDPTALDAKLADVYAKITEKFDIDNVKDIEIGSMIYAKKPGDGSAREQAASCQRVMGGLANICKEYATKRYRSNVMNWGMVPFQMEADAEFEVGDYIFVPNIRKALDGDMKDIKAYVIGDEIKELSLYIADMTNDEKEIVKAGCLINYNRNRKANK
ncbi:MAG: hydratase, partial [Intestinibacter sp.]